MNRFDTLAAAWDDQPHRQALAKAVVAAIAARIPIGPGTRLLDLGCGTGLIGLPLAVGAGPTLGLDTSAGMVARFTAKAAALGLDQVRGEVRDLAAAPLPAASLEVAVSAMTFHHIQDLGAVLTAIHRSLVPGGWLAVADLAAEDGSFHDEPVPHQGFAPETLAAALDAAGFTGITVEEVHRLHRPDRGRDYPVLLASGRRLSDGPCAR